MGVNAVGIDLSLTATGVMHSAGVGKLFGVPRVTTLPWGERLDALYSLGMEIGRFAMGLVPSVAVIEGLDMAQAYGGQIERSALWCQVVRGLRRDGVLVYIAPSPQVKMYATGKGSLPRGQEKTAVIEAVRAQWPHFDVDHRGRPDNNLADAAVMCALALEMAGEPLTEVSPEQLRAVQKTVAA